MARSLDLAKVRGDQAKEAGDFVQTQGRRNLIINGGFDVWQRGTSFSDTRSFYSSDRWRTPISTQNSATPLVSRELTPVNEEVLKGTKYFLRTSINGETETVESVCGLSQRIEGLAATAGRIITVSFTAKADGNKNIVVELGQNFGTGGTLSERVFIEPQTISLTSQWERFNLTFNVPSLEGKTLGTEEGSEYTEILFFLSAGSDFDTRTNGLGIQDIVFDIAQVQLEVGDTATPFEQRSYGEELALCQRYYWNTDNVRGGNSSVQFSAGIVYSADRIKGILHHPVIMRTRPVGVSSAVSGFQFEYQGSRTSHILTDIDMFGRSSYSAQIQYTLETAAVIGESGLMTIRDGLLEFDAEL